MKLISSYFKEMKIAFRGFYFYTEIIIAAIMLLILLAAVDTESVSKSKEFMFYNMPQKTADAVLEKSMGNGKADFIENTVFELKPAAFELTDIQTGDAVKYNFDDKKTVSLRTMQVLDPETGRLSRTVYLTDTEDDLLRLIHTEHTAGAIVSLKSDGTLLYRYPIQGYETDRLINLYYMLHNESMSGLSNQMDNQSIRVIGKTERLNNRENLIPAFIAFAGSLMGFFIIMAYIFLDKNEGVIKAFAVTPSPIWKYLLTKNLVILTTVVISSTVITIPVMGGRPDYPLFYLFLIITTFGFSCLGLLISSFFDSIEKAFGVLYLFMVLLMLPAFSYYIPSFDPLWIRFFPTYPVLAGFREILLGNGDVHYVLSYSLVFIAGGMVLFVLANIRFRKTLTV